MFGFALVLAAGTLLSYLAAHVWLIVIGVKARRWRTPGAACGLAGGLLGLAWPATFVGAGLASWFALSLTPGQAETLGEAVVRGMFALWGLAQAFQIAAAWRALGAAAGAAGGRGAA